MHIIEMIIDYSLMMFNNDGRYQCASVNICCDDYLNWLIKNTYQS